MPLSLKNIFHTKRFDDRLLVIKIVFSKAIMEKVWKKYIREGLRNQEVLDLHEYNDYHWGRKNRFELLYNKLCMGTYEPKQAIPVRIEKKNGVVRTIMLPTPDDCVVLQCIVEAMLPSALKEQPSKNSFFSRSHSKPNGKFDFPDEYIWFVKWIELSKQRLKIINTHKYICVTDITNYFDNIEYNNLRNIISDHIKTNEVTLDILFNVIDKISWRPDYLPSPKRSLPQVHFDAPRLLGHLYLYEIDNFLKKVTDNNFVRWVDDMTFAASSIEEGKLLLRDLDQLLMTRGLRLNSSKTHILSANEAHKFFYHKENIFLDNIHNRIKLKQNINKKELSKLRINFELLIHNKYGNYKKVIKRYINIFSTINSNYAVKFCCNVFESEPELRDTIIRYFSNIGYSEKTFNAFKKFLLGDHAVDDSSIMLITKALTQWRIRQHAKIYYKIRELAIELGNKKFTDKNFYFFLASMWLLLKYGYRTHMLSVIYNNRELWKNSEFIARQVASTYSKYRFHKEGELLKYELLKLNYQSVVSIFTSLDLMLICSPKINSSVRLYVLNGRNSTMYSIQRFLICLHILSCKNIVAKERRNLKKEVLQYVHDPIYKKVINAIKIA